VLEKPLHENDESQIGYTTISSHRPMRVSRS
jgi:hypothetical protein